jgi:hypothetical protein
VRNNHSKQKGEGMKRNLIRGLVVSLFAFALSAAAHAQDLDRLVVNIPYDFVVNGKSFPAGKYKVQRYSDSSLHQLALIDAERNTSAITLAGEVRGTTFAHPSVTLQQAGDQYFLTQIQTEEHIFVLPKSKAAFEAAAAKADRTSYLTGVSESRKR